MDKEKSFELEIERSTRTLESRTERFTIDDLVPAPKVPCLNLDDIVEMEAFKPKDSDDYLLIKCEPRSRHTICPVCHREGALVKNGTTDKPRLVHDVNCGLTQIDLLVTVPKYKCNYCNARPNHEFESIEHNAQFTKRLLELIKYEAFHGDFESVAVKYGISATTVGDLFDKFVDKLEGKRGTPHIGSWLAIDEKHIEHKMRGILVDGCTGRLLEMTENNSPNEMKRAIMSLDGYQNVRFVTTDMANGYRTIIEEIYGSSITYIVDKWHVLNDLQNKIKKARTIVLEYLADAIDNENDKEAKARKAQLKKLVGSNVYLFKYGEDKLKANTENARLLAEACSVFPEFNHLRLLKEGFERIYDCTNKKEALEAFNYWRQFVPPTAAKARMEWEEKYGVPAELYETLKQLERTVGTTWNREIFNYFEDSNTMKITNAIAESTNSFVTNFSCKGYKFSRLRSKALFWHEVTERKRYILETRKELKLKTGKSKQAGRKTSDVSYDMFNLFTSHNRNNDIYSELFEKVPVYGLFEVTEKIERKPLSVLSYLSPERKAEWNEAVRSLNNI